MGNVLTTFASKMPCDSRREKALATATDQATGAGRTRSNAMDTQSIMLYADCSNKGGRRGGSCTEGAQSILKYRQILMEAIIINRLRRGSNWEVVRPGPIQSRWSYKWDCRVYRVLKRIRHRARHGAAMGRRGRFL